MYMANSSKILTPSHHNSFFGVDFLTLSRTSRQDTQIEFSKFSPWVLSAGTGDQLRRVLASDL